jgi:hypothetical protein
MRLHTKYFSAFLVVIDIKPTAAGRVLQNEPVSIHENIFWLTVS